MKKWMVLVAALFTLTGIMSVGSSSASAPSTPVHVFIDGVYQKDMRMVDNYVLIPLRDYAPNRLGYSFRDEDKTIEVFDFFGKLHELKSGERSAVVGGKSIELKTPVMVSEEGRTYVPLSYLAEYMGAQVHYKPAEKRVIVRTPLGQLKYDTLRRGALWYARTMALELQQTYYGFPGGYNRPAIEPSGEGFTTRIYFPRGEALRYLMEYRGLLTYVEIDEDGIAVVRWVKDTLKDGVELGERPAPFEETVYVEDRFMTDEFAYGIIDKDGNKQELGKRGRYYQIYMDPIGDEVRNAGK